MFTALVNGDAKTLQKELNAMLRPTISFYDYAENFYHGFLAGVLSGMDEYALKSNRESGTGRVDLFAKPMSVLDPAFVIELKVSNHPLKLKEDAEKAIQQIKDKGYDNELAEEGFQDIHYYGISFFRKDCFVMFE